MVKREKMRDLDKNEVYDLRGITVCQARSLYEWLRVNDNLSNKFEAFYELIKQTPILEWDTMFDFGWIFINTRPTTKIQELFYENDLEYAKEQMEHYMREVDRLKAALEPKVGDVCKFWDNVDSCFIIGVIEEIDESNYPYLTGGAGAVSFRNARKLTEQEVIDLLFKKNESS